MGQHRDQREARQILAAAGGDLRQLSRRDLVRLLALGGGSLLLASCGGATPTRTSAPAASAAAAPSAAAVAGASAAPSRAASSGPAASTAPATQVKRGGRLVEASALANPGWDVHLSNIPTLVGHGVVFDTLLRYEMVDQQALRFELRPGLAERWEQPDDKTIVLYLRKGIKFHDGSDFNAAVAKWNLERMQQNPKAVARTQLTALDTVEAPDSHVVRLKLKTPSAAMLRILSSGPGNARAMISQAHFEKVGDQEFQRNPSGTGPMRLKSWVQDDRATLEPNKDFWGAGADGKPLPYLDELVSRFIPDLTTALVDLQAGSVHVIIEPPPKDVATVRNNRDVAYVPQTWFGVQYFTLGFNLAKAPLDNVKVRQAILYSIDREGMNKAVGFGIAQPHYYPHWGPSTLGWDESLPKYEFNLDKAKALLAEAGFANGIEFDLKFIRREPDTSAAEFQQQVWAKIGVKVKISALERLAWLDEMAAGKFDAAIWRGGSPFDPDLNTSITTKAATNYSAFSDPEIDRLMKEAGGVSDEQKRQGLYSAALRRLQEQAYVGTGIVIPYTTLRRQNVRGLIPQFTGVDFRGGWLE